MYKLILSLLLTASLTISCGDKTDTAIVEQEADLVCISYDFCCETLCEAEGETTHYGEPDPCDCFEDVVFDTRDCEPVDGECQFVESEDSESVSE
jgi:hypothetical protein